VLRERELADLTRRQQAQLDLLLDLVQRQRGGPADVSPKSPA
jgi:hypothetical protein